MARTSILALTSVFLTLGMSVAEAGSRSVTVTGPYGNTASRSGSGSCYGGTCSGSRTATGPYGNTVTRSGSASCVGGTCSGSRTTTGPRGQSISRIRSVTRY